MPATPTKIKPIHPTNDDRVTHEFAILNGRKYHYVQGLPAGAVRGVALLLHGYPDLWYGWRYIIPGLLEQGLRVIAPDLIGYGQTDKPVVKSEEDVVAYSMKSTGDDLAELLKQLGIDKAVVIGHDWGSFAAVSFSRFHPDLVSHIVGMAIPFSAPKKQYIPLDVFIQFAPQFTYMKTFSDDSKWADLLTTRESIKEVLQGLYTGAEDDKKYGNPFDVEKINAIGIRALLASRPKSDIIVTDEDLDYYVDQFTAGGFHGPANWYKLSKQTYEDEKDLSTDPSPIPALFVEASYDALLIPQFLLGQEKVFENLTYRKVPASHWLTSEEPDAVAAHLKEWLDGVVFGGELKL